MIRRKKLWPCEVEAQMTLVGAEKSNVTELSQKTVGRIAEGLQKFMRGDKRCGPKTRNYWIMLWFIIPGKREVSRAKLMKIVRRLEKKSIPEIQAFLMRDATVDGQGFLKAFISSDAERNQP